MSGIWLWICLVAAIVPAVAMLIYVYRQDRIEKEPTNLLLKLVGFGVLSALLASFIEIAEEFILGFFVAEELSIYPIMDAFIVVAIAEEGLKFLFLKKSTWKHPAFNYRFDAIVYATFVSLGFAAFENIFYVLDYGLGTAFLRALISIPGHFAFAVVMGYFYARAKVHEQQNEPGKCEKYLWLAFLVPMLLHGVFDGLLMAYSDYTGAIFLIFIIVFYVVVFRLLRKESKTDHPILSEETLNEQAAYDAKMAQMKADFAREAMARPVTNDAETVQAAPVPNEDGNKTDSYEYNE